MQNELLRELTLALRSSKISDAGAKALELRQRTPDERVGGSQRSQKQQANL